MSQTDQDFSAEDWARFLTSQLGRDVRVRFGRARRQVIVAFPERAGLRVRMNRVFGRAPAPVRTAVADWLRVGRGAESACQELDTWISSIVTSLGPPPTPREVQRGEHHDLGELTLDLLEHEFASLSPERQPRGVTWGRRSPSSARHSLQLGSFDPETSFIRIHPVLDQAAVPREFVRYVLFHELLHAELNQVCGGSGRTPHHGAEFRKRERAYPGTASALAWQEKHLPALLRSARTGKPMSSNAPRRAARFLQRLLFD